MGSKYCLKNDCDCKCTKCIKAKAGSTEDKHCYEHGYGCHKDCDGWLTS